MAPSPESTRAAREEALEQVTFRDSERARRNFERVMGRVPAGVAAALPLLLAESPDPDSALNLFDRLAETADVHVLALLERHPFLVYYALVVFAYSQYLGETLMQSPDVFEAMARERWLDRSRSREELAEAFARFRARSQDTDMALLLARFKRREYIRILLRDALQIAGLAETTAEISTVTDVLVAEALAASAAGLRERHGVPQNRDRTGHLVPTPFAVLALGKLGGNELNYSSDVDLMYVYGDGEEVESSMQHREYFIRLAQETTELLSRMTREGAPFRIDLRLRPQGGEGEPAISLRQALRYYAETARDWELQAMIKVRHCAGDLALGREFIRGVQPYVYRAGVNFKAIETALASRDRIHRRRHVQRSPQEIDLKLDRGGIRDIEFLVQCLQRVYGGGEPWLRSRGTLFALQKLHDKAHISGKEFHQLTSAYELLRKMEHRLQLRRGQQTHRLPAEPLERRIIYRSMGNLESKQRRMSEVLRQSMEAVAEIYERIIHQQQRQQSREPATVEMNRDAGAAVLERLAVDAPGLYTVASSPHLDPNARRNLHRFLEASLTSAGRYATLLENQAAVERALPLFEFSDYLTELLVRHPEDLHAIDTPAEAAYGNLFGAIAAGEGTVPVRLDGLRREHRRRQFAAVAHDLIKPRPLYESFEDYTRAAEAALHALVRMSQPPPDFAVMALGRLGTHEFDIASDADLVFMRGESCDPTAAREAAERIVQGATAYTREGILFNIDLRLRPHGSQGELVTTPERACEYFEHEGRAWEALTYTKIRFVAGSAELGAQAERIVTNKLRDLGRQPGFTRAVLEMRRRLEESDPRPLNYKSGYGGVYDVDFVVSWLALHRTPAPAAPIALEIDRLARLGALDAETARVLHAGADFYRTIDHGVRVVTGRGSKALPASPRQREQVERLVARLLRRTLEPNLEEELRRVAVGVREAFTSLLESAPL